VRTNIFTALLTLSLAAHPALSAAQEAPTLPASATEPQGFIPEPGGITRAAIYADRHLGKGDLTNGLYVDFGNMIPGAGWLSVGPGYRHWYKKDSVFIDASAAISSRNYRRMQARFELPKLARSRIALGTQLRLQDYRSIRYFDAGPASSKESESDYRLKSKQLAGYVTLRPAQWLALNAETSWLKASTPFKLDIGASPLDDARSFVTQGVSLTADGRDYPDHPTRGALARIGVVRYDDRDGGTFTFKQYEGEAAAFVPIGGPRVVLALRGTAVASTDGNVPTYFQPSLGGATSLRSYADYRFHDRHMALMNAELRLRMMTHADLAFFADAGNVAPRFGDLNFDKRSYGAGLRLHTRRLTFANIDVARGDEGWRFLFRLNDPLRLVRASRRVVAVPFVP
jgi:outer membrane protein assembly factor BamA